MKIINSAIIVFMFLIGIVLFPALPDSIPMHWNVFGQVDNYMPKNPAVFLLPILTTVMFIAFQIFPSFDPKKDKYRLFKHEWEIMQFGLVAFFAYLHFIILYLTLNPAVAMMPLMFVGLGVLFILMGNYMSKIRQNYFIGMKLPWTLASEDNWNKTHRFASWCFVGAGILTLAEAYFIWFAPVVIFGSIFLALALPIIYSFLLFKKAAHKMKYIYITLFAIIFIVGIIRLISGEDDWICERQPASAGGSGEARWVKHGQPSAPMPTGECK